ncbi:hypothetical protein GR160_03400 [Flavobacterium sp. Sd200]|uniref:hypothetical protein n=1 Tax=Flavobacterium sp. Sd200 TaxID=2692211 RepID=UPI00136F0ECA|nr:hypothetical protein [Flavobacterium sp. Sd200]MXN90262.1 hypothetical protein [Flavobacterium sp. Sd200]
MKKKYLLTCVLVLISLSLFSQDTIQKPKRNLNKFRMCILSTIYYMQPGSTGSNFLSAHKGKFGGGTEITFLTAYNFYLGVGYNFSQYEVEDASMAANAEHTNINAFFGKIYYKIPITEKFSINPAVMAGQIELRQFTGSKGYGTQEGWFIGPGIDAQYDLSKWVAIMAGARYNFITTTTQANAQYHDYFAKQNQFNIYAGLRIGLNK